MIGSRIGCEKNPVIIGLETNFMNRDAFKKKKSKLWDIVPKFSDPSPPRPFGTF